MVSQLGISIFIGTFIGSKLDTRLGNERPYLAMLFAFLSFAAGFYLTFKGMITKK
jgi:uncharacterized membrane protein YfcA